MKKYIGTKEVKAQPMTAYEASQKGYKTGESDRNRNGYEVEYKDGYRSWCPADVFEESYHEGTMEDVSDGYHTFKELYKYRLLYNAAFFNELAKNGKIKVCKSYKHNDGEDCFGGGWFIVMAELPTGKISNHYENKDWDLFKLPEVKTAWKWDGHTPMDVAERIERYLLSEE